MKKPYYLEKRKLKKGFVYYARLVDPAGKIYQTISTGQTSKARADIYMNDYLNKSNAVEAISITDYLDSFWSPEGSYVKRREAETGRKLSVSYLEGKKRVIEIYFKPWLAKNKKLRVLQDITYPVLVHFRDFLISENKLSPGHINNVMDSILTPLRQAEELEYIETFPGKRLKPLSEAKQRKESRIKKESSILEPFEAKKLFNPDYWQGDFISCSLCMFLYATGTRIGEAQGLQFKYVDFNKKEVNIVQQWSPTEGIKTPKWEEFREGIPLSDPILKSLEYIWLNYPLGKPGYESFCFPSIYTQLEPQPIARTTVRGRLAKAIELSGINKSITFHDLRHSWASLAKNILPDRLRSQILGHADTDITSRYTHGTDKERKQLEEFQLSLLN